MNIDSQEELLSQMIDHYKTMPQPHSQEQLVELLREVQELLGCIPANVQEEISHAMNKKITVIKSLIKLYPSLTSAPFRHKMILCMGPRCAAKQSEQILEWLKKELDFGNDSITKDGRFTLTVRYCIKQCKAGPNLMIDQDTYHGVETEKLPEILSQYH